jgi:peptidoglycan-N-acetylglucosamine deacetylase
MSSSQPIANLSFDLDNQWSYLKIHGDPGWETFPSYLDLLVPRVLDFLDKRELRITFFIVGQDAALEKNRLPLQMIAGAGHEIGNHSFSHEPWFRLYEPARIESEIALAEEHINKVTGQRPVGFRGPGYSFSEAMLEVLESRGYLYDSSTLPTFLGPVARIYYLSHSNLNGAERKARSQLFGSFADGFRPLSAYRWRRGKGLLEIPVTTMPLLRTPIHLSYLLYLSRVSTKLALSYFRAALRLCDAFSVAPSLLLHPLDFLGADDNVGLDFFPAMQIPAKQKSEFLSKALQIFCDRFSVVSLEDYAGMVSRQAYGSATQAFHRPSFPAHK